MGVETSKALPIPHNGGHSYCNGFRLAVYGHVNQDCGSSPGSHYLLIEYLLEQGHNVDLFAVNGFVTPQDLVRFTNLRYLPASLPFLDRALELCHRRMPERLGWLLGWILNTVRMWLYVRIIEQMIRRSHRSQRYDALLVLDVATPFRRIEGLPCINWAQGSPWGEWDAIRRNKSAVCAYGSHVLYVMLAIFYSARIARARGVAKRCDKLICCSRWTAGCWVRLGVPESQIAAIPFCLDLMKFRPCSQAPPDAGSVTFLHLGRLVPRKRLDLLLDGFKKLRMDHPEARLIVIGRVIYPKGYAKLLSPECIPPGVEYRDSVARNSIPELLQKIDVLVQPSENEDFGSAVMEALSCGKPVVLGPTNGTGEYTTPSCAFRFTDYSSSEVHGALVAAAIAVRKNRSGLSQAARLTAERYFSVNSVGSAVVQVIRSVRENVDLYADSSIPGLRPSSSTNECAS